MHVNPYILWLWYNEVRLNEMIYFQITLLNHKTHGQFVKDLNL